MMSTVRLRGLPTRWSGFSKPLCGLERGRGRWGVVPAACRLARFVVMVSFDARVRAPGSTDSSAAGPIPPPVRLTCKARMAYIVRHEVPPVSTYIDIRLAAGLSRKSEQAATIGLKNGLFSVVAYCDGVPVGIGRVIGDGGCFFEIVDIAVLPAHQKKGVGDLIMRALMGYVHENAPPTAYVSLMADHGTPKFYERYGFQPSSLPEKAGMFLRIA
ncbi:GNAT family N-acetyltransferase [Burkholderia cepacia]|nr:GNAT family N-acetyltransferase [Burkholderia cepacia]MCA8279669.1 GNAT family N-acetyltransferase [Burkholderia cepacia]